MPTLNDRTLSNLASELRAAGRETRSVRAALATAMAARALDSASSRQMVPCTPWPVFMLLGESLDDRDDVSVSWQHSLWARPEDAQAESARLTALAREAGLRLGNPTLTGLSRAERMALEDALGSNDPQAKSGEHGIRWVVRQAMVR